MAKKPPITNVTSGFSSTIALNNNFTSLRDGFDNTLSLDGSTPNAMQTELDLANNNIINAGSVETDTLLLGGVLMTPSGVDPVYSGTISSFGASLIDDVDAAAGRATLGLGTAATSSTTDFVGTSGSGTITGDLDITGDLEVTSDGLPSTVLDRLNSDGTILELKKDGTTVGSISTKVDAVDGVGDMYLGTGDTGLFFHDRNNQILPVDTATGLTRNSIVHLGSTSAKFAQVHSATFHGDGSNLTNTPNKSFAESYVTYSGSTPTQVDGYGFSSVSRPAVGQTSFVFSTAQPDTNYVVDIKFQGGIGAGDARWSSWVYAKSTTGYTVIFRFVTLAASDVDLWTTARRLT